MMQIRAQIDAERVRSLALPCGGDKSHELTHIKQNEATSYWHIFTTKSLRHRALCSIIIWTMNIGCGILVIANLTPLLFAGLGFGQNTQLGLSVVWVFTSGVGASINGFLLDRFGRRLLLRKSFRRRESLSYVVSC